MENESPKEKLLHPILNAYDEAIAHYDFVLNDLSSDIYNPTLQAQKAPVISFLTAMRDAWQKCRDDAKKHFDSL